MHAGHQISHLALMNVPAISVYVSSSKSRSVFWDIMNVIQQAAIRFGCPAFCENLSGGWLLCMNPMLCTLTCKIYFSKLHFICKMQDHILQFSCWHGAHWSNSWTVKPRKIFLFSVSVLWCGLVKFKPPLCSGINWKATAKMKLAFSAFWGLHAEVLSCKSVPLLWLLSVWHELENIPLS